MQKRLIDSVPVVIFAGVTVALLIATTTLHSRVGNVEGELEQLNTRVGNVERGLETTNERIDQTNERLDRMQETLVEISRTLGRIEGNR